LWSRAKELVEGAINPIANLVDDVHTSEEEKMKVEKEIEKVKNEMTKEFIELHQKELKAKKEIIIAEAKGGWLQKNWRPILMLSIVAIVVNNYIVYPYLSMFTDNVVVLDLPSKLWNLMLVGVGGYVGTEGVKEVAGRVSPNHNSNLKD
jgi:hypothetical protein